MFDSDDAAEREMKAKPTGSCCSPSAKRGSPSVVLDEIEASGRTTGNDTHKSPGPSRIRARMISLPGGSFLMGSEDSQVNAQDGEGPVREVFLDAFQIDPYPITNDDFAEFVKAAGYRTEAEEYGWSFVFWAHIRKDRFNELVEDTVANAPWWCRVRGAYWKAPFGPGSTISDIGNHPAVHITWNDAQAFCRWSGLRLASEAEWEYAARGGLTQKLYPWGDKLRPDGQYRCNIWQGEFPNHDSGEDGFTGTCPVDAFPPNGFGLYSMTGNSWEWCTDWFDPTFHITASQYNPQGSPQGQARVMRGGSFLCHRSYCNRYRVAARSSNTPDSSTSNLGFRCAL